jgi:hypothetical protein
VKNLGTRVPVTAPIPMEPGQIDGWNKLGLAPPLTGLRLHLCSWNASKASAGGAEAVGTARGIKCFHPQRRQPHPIKKAVCIQTSVFLTSAISAIMPLKMAGYNRKIARRLFFSHPGTNRDEA